MKIQIDDRVLDVEPGATIIEVADRAGIYIPRFCYHPELSVAANCRMCLVEVEKSPRPLPACATPVTDGMRVLTQSAGTKEAQRGVMEFLLINHPLDCPICDQGGQCELQDLSLGFGQGATRYNDTKRAVAKKAMGPLIETEMTRCINCTRCVRFGTEIAGEPELGVEGRGEQSEISLFIEGLQSELSANVIDICPVGALTAKPSRYQARPWELTAVSAFSIHDAYQSACDWHVKGKRLIRVVPRRNDATNEIWLSDRDRFSYLSMASPDRLQTALVKKADGQWEAVDLEMGLHKAASLLKEDVKATPALSWGVLAHPSSSLEELRALRQMGEGLGSTSFQAGFHAPALLEGGTARCPRFGLNLEEMSQLDHLVVIGSPLRLEWPLLSTRIRKWQRGSRGRIVTIINPLKWDWNFKVHEEWVPASGQTFEGLLWGLAAGLYQHFRREFSSDWRSVLDGVVGDWPIIGLKAIRRLLRLRRSGRKPRGHLLLGYWLLNHPNGATLCALAEEVARILGYTWGMVTLGSNVAGAFETRFLESRSPQSKSIRHWIWYGLEPDQDVPGWDVQAGFERVIAFSAFDAPFLREKADVILPIRLPWEEGGHFINAWGELQSVPADKVAGPCGLHSNASLLSSLGQRAGLIPVPGGAEELLEGKPLVFPLVQKKLSSPRRMSEEGLRLILCPGIYRIDPMVRRSTALQNTRLAEQQYGVRLSAATAVERGLGMALTGHCQLQQGQRQVSFPYAVDNGVPFNRIFLWSGYAETGGFRADELVEVKPL